MSKICILIPARYQSSRFPGKPLALIKGVSMIRRVLDNSELSGYPSFVVTDDERIESHLHEFGGKVLRVDDDVPSGTQRIGLAYERYLKAQGVDMVVNVQGDEPLLPGRVLSDLIDFHCAHHFDVTTLVVRRERSAASWNDPNVVKAVVGQNNECLYFSRSSVPYDRDGREKSWLQHVGVYCYSAQALERFCAGSETLLSQIEQLEQLKGMEFGLKYGALEVKLDLVGVDRPEDIKRVEELI
jgi:3-deoxy-manno-octulosonate cytidylyltransferase (CMP-KDO synthetase)